MAIAVDSGDIRYGTGYSIIRNGRFILVDIVAHHLTTLIESLASCRYAFSDWLSSLPYLGAFEDWQWPRFPFHQRPPGCVPHEASRQGFLRYSLGQPLYKAFSNTVDTVPRLAIPHLATRTVGPFVPFREPRLEHIGS